MLELVPINSQGTKGAVVSDSAVVLAKYAVGTPVKTGTITPGGTITATVNIKNNEASPAKIAVILGYYENEVLIATGIQEETIAAGATQAYAPTFTLPQTVNNGEIRMFVWMGNTGNTDFSMKPIHGIIPIN